MSVKKMDRFKRKQSQVFWKQMEVHDMRREQNREILRNLSSPIATMSKETKTDENLGSPDLQHPSREQFQLRRCCEDDQLSETDGPSSTAEAKDRSSSPTSYCAGQRSQDSGFSDSERSADSDIGSRAGSLRRTRSKKSHRKRSEAGGSGRPPSAVRIATRGIENAGAIRRLDSPWTPEEQRPHPIFTSTPNRNVIHDNRELAALESHQCCGSNEVPRVVVTKTPGNDEPRVPRLLSLSLEDVDECLGDFLYANEPPEDLQGGPNSRVHDEFEESSNVRKSSRDEQDVERAIHMRQSEAVRSWLSELAHMTEVECSATLQSKALPRRYHRHEYTSDFSAQTRDITLLTASATAAATKLLARANRFQERFQSTLEGFQKLQGNNHRYERGQAVQSIEEDASLLLSELGAPLPRKVRNSNSCKEVIRELKNLVEDTNRAVDARLDFYIERVVRGLEESPHEGNSITRGALAALTVLGMRGARSGRSIARCFGVRALLTALLSVRKRASGSSEMRCACLRALASVCCCPEAIEQLVENAGPEILADLLADTTSSPEVERMEATALIVQITAPWMDGIGLPNLEPFANSLVRSLTDLAETTRCSQTLLLATAALNNLSRSRRFVHPMVEYSTVSVLLKSVKRSEGGNVWLMEQVAALIGELARLPDVRSHLAEARASVALVCFLRMRPPGFESAYRKLEATASAALARLCVEERVARQIVTVGGTSCLPYRNATNEGRCTRSLRLAYKRATALVDAAAASANSEITSDF